MRTHRPSDDLNPLAPVNPEAPHTADQEETDAKQDAASAVHTSQEPTRAASGGPTTVKRTPAQQRALRRSFGRWLIMAPVRILYRGWTRIAANLFPESTGRAHLAEQVGIPLPDRLDMSWVTDSLAVGGRIREEDIERLAQSGVTSVVDTRAEYKDDEAALNQAGIQLLYLPTPDTQPLTIEQLLEGSAWVLEQIRAGGKVLIHCEHGVGRSVLLTASALVRDGFSTEDALHLVQTRRWQASPNHRQIKRLHEFEEAVRVPGSY
ncbi:MAG TPA: dual specificity protein phosphatase [Ktedonobacterales bacterium]|nr:dual specificity protein phosphatase [Ktedonobacterales bacterium]